MASTILRSAGRALSRSIPRALEGQHPCFPRSLAQAPRRFSSGSLGRTEPIQQTMYSEQCQPARVDKSLVSSFSSHTVARLDESGNKRDILEQMMPHDEFIYRELDKIEKKLLKNGEIIEEIQAAVTARNERDKMYSRVKAGLVGVAAVASGVAGLAVLTKKALFG